MLCAAPTELNPYFWACSYKHFAPTGAEALQCISFPERCWHVVRSRTDSPWRACAPSPESFWGCPIQQSKTPLAAQTGRSMFPTTIAMEKPNARGPSPSRKAHLALRERLNRKPKLPPVPVKKNLPTARRTTGR
jgi:hypothetical protein